ncbi:MAG: FAD-dependent oxidoreductase [Deltaproteobacteria bacterium]|nr:FAD-dependent oxidoreductase [Deltaproteobacteria bacterium]
MTRALGGAALAGLASACGDDDKAARDTSSGDGDGTASDASDTAGDADTTPITPGSVVIVGAGMAGLHCAYRLKLAGVDAQVVEAASRVGGRMWTKRDGFADGQLCEIGGELIDTPHTIMQSLADELDIALDDLKTTAPVGETAETFYFNGKLVTHEELIAEWAPLAPKLKAAVDLAESDDDEFARLDQLSIPDFLVEAGAGPLIKEILEVAFTEEYGLEASVQPILNLLYLIDAETVDELVVFGESDERFHTHTGNETFIEKLAAELTGQIRTHAALTRVAPEGEGYRLTFERQEGATDGAAGSTFELTAAHVVLTIPFTLLREVDLSALDLPAAKTALIQELGYGTNAKLMMQFDERVWQTEHNASGAIFSDNGIQTSWDTSRGQSGAHGIITNFVGGNIGVAMGEGTAEERAQAILPAFDAVFPGMKDAYVTGSAVRMQWPTHPWTKGSYACYLLGQWASYGTEGTRVGGLHFAGEHTSLTWQGYMEGAAESGVFAAIEVLEALGKTVPGALTALVEGRDAPLPPEEVFGAAARPARSRFRNARRSRAVRRR